MVKNSGFGRKKEMLPFGQHDTSSYSSMYTILLFCQLLEDHTTCRTSVVYPVKNLKEIKFIEALSTLISGLV